MIPLLVARLTGAVCCADSQFVILLPNDTRTGTEEFIFDTKQANKIYYFTNYVSGVGTGTLNVQVKNEITGNWETTDFIGTFSSVGEVLDVSVTPEPDNSLTRIQLITTGTWEGSVGALLVDPKFSE